MSDKPIRCGDYAYRYTAVRGVERRADFCTIWHPVTGAVLEAMTSAELRAVADAMEGRRE